MAKFCTKCGKPLEDGKPCDCEKNEKVTTTTTSNDLGDNFLNIFKEILIKPFTTVKEYAKKENTTLALILAAINVIVFGLFTYFFLSSFVKGITNQINKIANTSSIFGSSSISTTSSSNISFGNSFLIGIIAMAIGLIVLTLMTKLFIGVVFKNKKSFKDYFVLYGINTPLSTLAMVIAIIASFISYKLALIILFLGTVLYFVNVTQCLLDNYKLNKEKASYAISLTIATTYIITIIIVVIVLGILIYNNQVSYY